MRRRSGACLSALDACLDALAQFVAIDSAQVLGIGVEHLRCDGHGGLLLVPGTSSCASRGLAGLQAITRTGPVHGADPSCTAPASPPHDLASRRRAAAARLADDRSPPPGLHLHVGGRRRSTVFTGIGGDSWVRAATAASETAAEAVLEHVLRSILDTTGLDRSKGARA